MGNSNAANAALMWGGTKDGAKFLKAILERGVPVDHKDTFGSTTLHWCALFSGDPTLAKLVIEYRADVNAIGQPADFTHETILAGTRFASKLGVDSEMVKYFTE